MSDDTQNFNLTYNYIIYRKINEIEIRFDKLPINAISSGLFYNRPGLNGREIKIFLADPFKYSGLGRVGFLLLVHNSIDYLHTFPKELGDKSPDTDQLLNRLIHKYHYIQDKDDQFILTSKGNDYIKDIYYYFIKYRMHTFIVVIRSN